MKYIKKFEETEDDSEINLENHKDEIEKVFETKNWIIINPKTLEALYYWSQDQGWSDIEGDIDRKYKHYDSQDLMYIYININKTNDDRIFFDFHKSTFYGENEYEVYLKDFFDSNPELLSYYGEILTGGSSSDGVVVKDSDDYWFVIDDYNNFSKYFKLDRNTRKDLIETVLGGDSFDIFNYNPSDISIDSYNIDFDEENLILAKVILLIEKQNEDHDYEVTDINDYDDVVEVVKEYDIDDLKDLLTRCVCEGVELADADAAYEDITNEIYKFFNFELGSAKWDNYKQSKNQKLWIKFKSKSDAYRAKMIILNYDNSYEDDIIDYSPPYYGYSGESKVIEEHFNEAFIERLDEFYKHYENEIEDYKDAWKNLIKENPNMVEEDILKELDIVISAKRYGM